MFVFFVFFLVETNQFLSYIEYILSFYSPFSDRVGLPLHNTPFPGVLMKSIGAVFFRPDTLHDVNHMCGMQYQIVLNIVFWSKLN